MLSEKIFLTLALILDASPQGARQGVSKKADGWSDAKEQIIIQNLEMSIEVITPRSNYQLQ